MSHSDTLLHRGSLASAATSSVCRCSAVWVSLARNSWLAMPLLLPDHLNLLVQDLHGVSASPSTWPDGWGMCYGERVDGNHGLLLSKSITPSAVPVRDFVSQHNYTCHSEL